MSNPLVHLETSHLVYHYYEEAKKFVESDFDSSNISDFKKARGNIVSAKTAAMTSDLGRFNIDDFIEDLDNKFSTINNLLCISEEAGARIDYEDEEITYFLTVKSDLSKASIEVPMVDLYQVEIPELTQRSISVLEGECLDYLLANNVSHFDESLNDYLFLLPITPVEYDDICHLIHVFYNYIKCRKDEQSIINIWVEIQKLTKEIEHEIDRFSIYYALFMIMLEFDLWVISTFSGYSVVNSHSIFINRMYDNVNELLFENNLKF